MNSFLLSSDYRCGPCGRCDFGRLCDRCRDLRGPSGLRAVASPVDSDRSEDGSNRRPRMVVAASVPGPICSGGRSVSNSLRPNCSRAPVRLPSVHSELAGERFRCKEKPGQKTGPRSPVINNRPQNHFNLINFFSCEFQVLRFDFWVGQVRFRQSSVLPIKVPNPFAESLSLQSKFQFPAIQWRPPQSNVQGCASELRHRSGPPPRLQSL